MLKHNSNNQSTTRSSNTLYYLVYLGLDLPIMSSADAPPATSPPPAADVDTNLEVNDNIDEDNETAPIEPTLPSMDSSNDAPNATDPVDAKAEESLRPEIVEPRIPAKKDATLREFLGKMDDYAPIVHSLIHPLPQSPRR